MRKNVRVKTAMLMILVMAVLSACGGNDKVDTLPLPTAMAETEVPETVAEPKTETTVTAETEEFVATVQETTEMADEEPVTESRGDAETEEFVTEECAVGDDETVQETTEMADEEPVTESKDETPDKTNIPASVQPETPKESDAGLAETTEIKQEEPEVVHTHSYTASITVNSGCETVGVMTYACSCGDSYTEPIPAAGHAWTTTTGTVYHPSLGHMERTEKKIVTIQCGCGFTTQDNDELDRHCIAEGHEDYPCGCVTKTVYEDNWVVTQEAWEETVTRNVCTVCGLTQ